MVAAGQPAGQLLPALTYRAPPYHEQQRPALLAENGPLAWTLDTVDRAGTLRRALHS